MSRDEVKAIYTQVCDLFPNFKPYNPQATFNMWVGILGKYEKPQIEEMLKKYIESNPGGYAPNISNLIPRKEAGGFTGRIYTKEDYEAMEEAGTAWIREGA